MKRLVRIYSEYATAQEFAIRLRDASNIRIDRVGCLWVVSWTTR
jgi:hypothetical protein